MLEVESPELRVRSARTTENAVRLFYAENAAQAHALVSALARVGVSSRIEGATSVWLARSEQHDSARRAVFDFLFERVPTAVELCAGCSEENPAAHGRCWVCGELLAGAALRPRSL